MNDHLVDKIPSLDLNDFVSGDTGKKNKFVQDLGEAFQSIGFVAIRNHGLSDDLTQNLYGAVKDFFLYPTRLNKNTKTPAWPGNAATLAKGKNTPRAATPAT